MFNRLNPLNHPVAFAEPGRLKPSSAWHEHIPFAMLLIDLARPRTFVELGTHGGDSYCAFCQAVAALQLDTRCFAVDTWSGDAHSQSYGPTVLADLRAHHDPLYGAFSELIQATFDEAGARFADQSVDLLHIDGFHTYEAVSHDFHSWLPKMSSRGIVLFHDIAVTGFGFGVKTLWEEVKARYPSFEFHHGHGLGTLAVGGDQPPAMQEILGASAEDTAALRGLFAALGERFSLRVEVARKNDTIQNVRRSLGWRLLRRLNSARLMPRIDAD
jgi:predicted O-methyltransferase YrrM